MEINQFRKVLQAFAENPSDVDIRLGGATFQIRDDIFDVTLKLSSDDNEALIVSEYGQDFAARIWLLNRVAKLPQLAERLIAVCGKTQDIEFPFVRPTGRMSPELSTSENASLVSVPDAAQALMSFADTRSVGAASVLYLTSDAGEGKTTLINRVAFEQAKRYKEKTAKCLVVPIPLSGRSFLTFDDAVIAALVNKLRFNYFYFDAFVWLVRLGAIVPAFDGYEEMLVEGSKGEAVSALGGLVQSLESSGSVVIAARKAFFDYVSFKSQARLLDAIGDHAASFSKLEIQRWDRTKALEYGVAKKAEAPEQIYDAIADRLGGDHPLLTRAVLVTRLFEVAHSGDEGNRLAQLLGDNPQDFFFTFVDALVNREAKLKWLARVSGEVMEPLLAPAEHHELLAQIAIEMWQTSSRHIKFDLLDVLVELFSEVRKKSGSVTRQVKERIKQHSLLASNPLRPMSVEFDHEDFQDFYLGEGLGRLLAAGNRSDLYSALAVNVFSNAAIVQGIQYVARIDANIADCIKQIQQINAGETGFSFCKENCAVLALRLSEHCDNEVDLSLTDMYFPADSLRGRRLKRVKFDHCHFQPSSINNASFDSVVFDNCEFERLDLEPSSNELSGCEFSECRVDSILLIEETEYIFDPSKIVERLRNSGSSVTTEDAAEYTPPGDDFRLKLLSRFFRIFLRTTQVNEDVIKLKLGGLSPRFFDEVLPELESRGVLSEVTWDGRGVQRRFRLAIPMTNINRAFEKSSGSFEGFLSSIKN